MQGFTNFAEVIEDQPIADPNAVAARWLNAKSSAKGEIVRTEVKRFADRLSDPEVCQQYVTMSMLGRDMRDRRVYDQPLQNKLVRVPSPKKNLGRGYGILFSVIDPEHETIVGVDTDHGDMAAILPALLYDDVDVLSLEGIIHHECQHVLDYAAGIPSDYRSRMTLAEYASLPSECRAYRREFSSMLREVMSTGGFTAREAVTTWSKMRLGCEPLV